MYGVFAKLSKQLILLLKVLSIIRKLLRTTSHDYYSKNWNFIKINFTIHDSDCMLATEASKFQLLEKRVEEKLENKFNHFQQLDESQA